MKVRELIDQLSKLDPNLEVYAASEDVGVVLPGYHARPFEITGASAVAIETSRDAQGRPQIAAAAAGEGSRYVVIDITADF